MTIYKPCDIRGDADKELTPALYKGWGQTLGQRLPPMAKFLVGGDVRASTPPFLAALIEGLCQAGLDVVDLGLLPTPMIYYAKQRLHADGCAIVTASHNPATVNGLKWMLGDQPTTWRRSNGVKRKELETMRAAPSPSRGRSTFRSITWRACKRRSSRVWLPTGTWCLIRCTVAGRNGRGATCTPSFRSASFPRFTTTLTVGLAATRPIARSRAN
jgi:hypothetical protein